MSHIGKFARYSMLCYTKRKMKINYSDIISICSAIAAWVAALLAYRSSRIAKRSLAISENQEQDRSPNLEPYLSESFTCKTEDDLYRIYAFSILVNNKSDMPNTLSRAELSISYRYQNDLITNILLPHSDDNIIESNAVSIVPIILPAQIDIRHTISGWFVFKIRREQLTNLSIENYQLKLYDSRGNISIVRPIIIKEIIDENEIQKN